MKKNLALFQPFFLAALAMGLLYSLFLNPPALAAVFFVDATVADGGPDSLRDAIGQANAYVGEDTIELQSGTYVLTLGQLEIQQDLLIRGSGADMTIIDGARNGRVIYITTALDPDINVKIVGVTITGGAVNSEETEAFGGGIYNEGNLTINSSKIIENTVVAGLDLSWGGGIFNNGNLICINSSISNNAIFGQIVPAGGGICTWGDNLKVNIIQSKINGNKINGGNAAGGGIANYGSNTTLAIIRSQVSGNRSGEAGEGGDGGGIYNWGGYVAIKHSQVHGNTAVGGVGAVGGGICSFGDLNIEFSQVTQNLARGIESGEGGGIWCDGNTTIKQSRIVANAVNGGWMYAGGGGINNFGNLTILYSQVTGNIVRGGEFPASGGGIDSSGDLTISYSQVSGNTVKADEFWSRGGGIYISAYGNQAMFRLIGSMVNRNTASCPATEEGGGIWVGNTVSYLPISSIVFRNSPDQVFFEP